jgi:hypothetical protein
MEYWLATSPWPGVVLWIILYTSDYYLTIYNARGFREIGRFHFEGSYELTPQYQNDIDALKPVSRLHLVLLVVYSLAILGLWWLFTILPYVGGFYTLYLGMFLLLEVAVHFRHLRNLFLVQEIRSNGGVEGEITYRRWFSYKLSAFEIYLFAGLYLLVAVLTFSPFFLGGAIICAGMGFRHSRLSKKSKLVPAQTDPTKS